MAGVRIAEVPQAAAHCGFERTEDAGVRDFLAGLENAGPFDSPANQTFRCKERIDLILRQLVHRARDIGEVQGFDRFNSECHLVDDAREAVTGSHER